MHLAARPVLLRLLGQWRTIGLAKGGNPGAAVVLRKVRRVDADYHAGIGIAFGP